MDNNQLDELLLKLNQGAAMMDEDKLPGARVVTDVGHALAEVGGKALLRKAHSLALPEHQRTIELQWCGITDRNGEQWLP